MAHPARSIEQATRDFWQKAQVNEETRCWEWTGGYSGNGYGNINWFKRYVPVHKLAFELVFGSVSDGFYVCHRCDNPKCYSPFHLFQGTPTVNNLDRSAKGRNWDNRGENCPNVKLTEVQAREILTSSEPPRVFVQKYGIKSATVCNIRARRIWKHL